MTPNIRTSRRQFLQTALAGAAGASLVPTIIPAYVLGTDAPSNKIQIGQIGCGRIAHDMDMPGILKHDRARIVAVCDLDSRRVQHAKLYVEGAYAKKKGSANAVTVKTFGDYRELLRDGHVDAVAISTPEHWHAELVIAARAGRQRHLRPEAALHDPRRRPRGQRHRPHQEEQAPSRSAASSDPPPSSASPVSWCATDASASCIRLRSACPVDPAGGDPRGNARPPQSEL